jgi:hypothetical protein
MPDDPRDHRRQPPPIAPEHREESPIRPSSEVRDHRGESPVLDFVGEVMGGLLPAVTAIETKSVSLCCERVSVILKDVKVNV